MTGFAHPLFTVATIRLINRWSSISMFRHAARLGSSAAFGDIFAGNLAFVDQLLTEPEHESVFRDKEKLIRLSGGAEGMAATLTAGQRKGFQAVLDASSLVFMHSALDGVAADYCRVSADVSPGDWEPFVAKRKISVESVKASDFATLLRRQIGTYLKDLCRESLPTKVDRLFQVCKPRPGFRGKPGYTFDRERLASLDKARHAVVHGSHALVPLATIDDDLQYLFDTGWLLTGLLNHRYDVRIDPELPGAWKG